MCPMLVNKTSHKFTGKLGQKVDKTKCGHIYKISLINAKMNDRKVTFATKTKPSSQFKMYRWVLDCDIH